MRRTDHCDRRRDWPRRLLYRCGAQWDWWDRIQMLYGEEIVYSDGLFWVTSADVMRVSKGWERLVGRFIGLSTIHRAIKFWEWTFRDADFIGSLTWTWSLVEILHLVFGLFLTNKCRAIYPKTSLPLQQQIEAFQHNKLASLIRNWRLHDWISIKVYRNNLSAGSAFFLRDIAHWSRAI